MDTVAVRLNDSMDDTVAFELLAVIISRTSSRALEGATCVPPPVKRIAFAALNHFVIVLPRNCRARSSRRRWRIPRGREAKT